MQFHHRARNAGQTGDMLAAGFSSSVGLRQEEHVLHDHRHALDIFEVRAQHIPQRVGIACFAQSDFGAPHQRRQRREQFMRNVSIEGFQLFVGFVQTLQQFVDVGHQRSQFVGLSGAIQKPVQSIGLQCLDLSREVAHGTQPDLHQRKSASSNHHCASECGGDERAG